MLDVDGEAGLETLAQLEDRHRWLPLGPASITGSGGMHLFFAPCERVRNSVRRLGSGLDTRSTGGFVVLPPSVHPNGTRYRWCDGRSPVDLPLPPAPDWLLELLDPPRQAYERPAATHTTTYAAAALAGELDAVARAPKSERNATLYKSACRLARFVKSGELSATTVGPALIGAAMATGLSKIEAEKTALSGLGWAVRS